MVQRLKRRTMSEDESEAPAFVKVAEKDGDEDFMELPREKDDTVLLSTIQAQFSDAIGLKYKGSSGGWRGVRAENNVLEPPHGGWGETVYVVTQTDPSKRRSEDDQRKRKKKNKLLEDLIVFGIPLSVKNEDLKEYFQETCGEMEYAEIKQDRYTKKSRGFGFIRFKTEDGAKEALSGYHEIAGKKLAIKYSDRRTTPLKLFVGRLPRSATHIEVKDYFSDFGDLDDIVVPAGRGFAFVTFSMEEDGKGCLRAKHVFQGAQLSVVIAEPRDGEDFYGPRGRRGEPLARGRGVRGRGRYGGPPPPRERIRDRSNERYDKYASDRVDDRRTRDRYSDRYGGGSYDDRRRGGGSDNLGGGADIVSELKNMLYTLVNNHK